MPTITAVLSCYNAAAFIAEAISSVQRQTRQVDEILVVDDCSTDDSAAIARALGVRVVSTGMNSGAAAARNLGIRESTGELVAFLDADDRWSEHHCATLERLLHEHPDAGLGFALVQLFGDHSNVWWKTIPEQKTVDAFWESCRKVIAQPSGSMFRRGALLDTGGFDETIRHSEDYEFLLRFSQRHRVVCTYEVTAYYRKLSTGKSQNLLRTRTVQYAVRHRLWQEAVAAGDAFRAERLARVCREVWDEHLRGCVQSRNSRDLRIHMSMAGYVPDNGYLLRKYCAFSLTLWAHRLWDRLPLGLRCRLKQAVPARFAHSALPSAVVKQVPLRQTPYQITRTL
jgi:glycosyltransferase involved in cell wall biosynthesis